MKKSSFSICVLMSALVLSSGAGAQGMPPATVVVDEAAFRMLAPTVEVPGTVVSRYDARLASELSAKLQWIAEVGTEVKKGDTVARLEDITFRLREMEAQSLVDRAEAAVVYLKAEKARLERLAENNLSAASQLERVTSELAIAEADRAIAEVQLGHAKVAMHVTEVRAPFDGIVTERLRNIGERLTVADEVIRLVDPNSLEVVARAPLSTVNFIAKGAQLELSNDYHHALATVRTIVPFGDPQSHMFEVRLDADPEIWTVGESARLSMPTADAKEVLAVPRDALVLRREGASIFKVNQDMTVQQVSVITGLGAGSQIEIFGEIQAGDQVVIRGAERLEEGMSVSIGGNQALVLGNSKADP
jgi:RND family efflux transporter MFP subunit